MNLISSSRNKIIISIIFVVLLGVVLFSLKTKSEFKNQAAQKSGLVYSGNETIGELTNRDSDGDGLLDWEEDLWGTDPTKADTDGNGISDGEEIAKKKSLGEAGNLSIEEQEENLTQTDRFSRELFSTVATLNQAGEIDQDTIDNLSASLIEQIQSVKKVILFSDLKIINDSSVQVAQTYNSSLESLIKKFPIISKNGTTIVSPIQDTFVRVFQEFLSTENTAVLSKLDPIIKEVHGIIDGMTKMPVPQGFAILHLNVINGLERVVENLSDLKFAESDPIIAMGAASKFKENIETLQSFMNKLRTAISQKINY